MQGGVTPQNTAALDKTLANYPNAKVQELDPVYTQDSTVDKAVRVVVVIGLNDQPA